MSPEKPIQVAGVDGCKAGWAVAVASITMVADNKDCAYRLQRFLLAANFADILSETNDCKLVCVDIPIGLSGGSEPRVCDIAARRLLGGRRASSVFPPPIRQCISAKDYKAACDISFEHSGRKLSKQSFFLLDKIRQVDDLMTPTLQEGVREIHPEISFCALNKQKPMYYNKTIIAGRKERIKLLAPIFSQLERVIAEARKPKEVAPDDILDALVAAWTAGQAIIGRTKTLPENPELDSKGLRMEILHPACYNQ